MRGTPDTRVKSLYKQHYRSLSACLTFWASMCEELNQLNFKAFVAMFACMGVVSGPLARSYLSGQSTVPTSSTTTSPTAAPSTTEGSEESNAGAEIYLPREPKLDALDIDIIFRQCNAEDGADSVLNEMNNDRLLCRFEYFLSFFHAARTLYWTGCGMQKQSDKIPHERYDDITVCVEKFFRLYVPRFIEQTRLECLKASDLPLDPDVFRRQHLYRPGVNYFLHRYGKEIQSFYNSRCTVQANRRKLIGLKEWLKLLHEAGLFQDYTELDNQEGKMNQTEALALALKKPTSALRRMRSNKAQLEGASESMDAFTKEVAVQVFAQSQMFDIQPLSTSLADDTMDYYDFLEGLARVAFMIAHDDDVRPLMLKFNDMWQGYFRGFLRKRNGMHKVLVDVLESFIDEQGGGQFTHPKKTKGFKAKMEANKRTIQTDERLNLEWERVTSFIIPNCDIYGREMRDFVSKIKHSNEQNDNRNMASGRKRGF